MPEGQITGRGQPLAIIALLLGSWIFLRAMTWSAPGWLQDGDMRATMADGHEVASLLAHKETEPVEEQATLMAAPSVPGFSTPWGEGAWGTTFGGRAFWDSAPSADYRADYGANYWQNQPAQAAMHPAALQAGFFQPAMQGAKMGQDPMLAAGHQLMWMAALARVAVPPELASYMGQTIPAAPAPIPLSPGLAERDSRPSRWSADGWVMMRREGVAMAPASRPLYGASQMGAVVRYRLAPGNAHRPIAYVRGSTALGQVRESEVAAGLAMRPVASLPVMAGLEARAFRSGGRTTIRPAALAYTEIAPVDLGSGWRADSYMQAGYVGGAFKTPFIDGQLRVDREMLRIGGVDLRVGGGIWGGAQKGAHRLDIGPGTQARLNLMGRPSLVSMDWRFRVAGDVDPGSGPTLTVATGF